MEALPGNILQSLRAAGLLAENPNLDVIRWWDEIASIARSEHDKVKMENGRLAESLTMELELARLQALGLSVTPRWISVEDNSAGYDVLSYDLGPHGPTARMIEVKSCSSSTFGFYLSRGEWETALRSQSYVIHLWKLPTNELTELDSRTVAENIPNDQGAGKWQVVYVTVPRP